MEYIKIYTDFQQILEPLTAEETGRLFLAMLKYAETGEEPNFTGNERFVWNAAKRDINVAEKKAQKLRANGLRGGRPKTKANQEEPNETKENQSEPNETKANPHTIPYQDIPYHTIPNHNHTIPTEDPLTLTEEDIAGSIKRDSMIEEAAQSVGLQLSEKAMLKARNLCEQYGTEEVIKAINASVDVPKWAYVEGILRNGGVNDGNGRSHVKELPSATASQYAFLNGSV